MQRTIFKSGNSLVVALPADALNSLNVREGSTVEISIDAEHHVVTLSSVPGQTTEISHEFGRQVEQFIEAYRPALEALSNR